MKVQVHKLHNFILKWDYVRFIVIIKDIPLQNRLVLYFHNRTE